MPKSLREQGILISRPAIQCTDASGMNLKEITKQMNTTSRYRVEPCIAYPLWAVIDTKDHNRVIAEGKDRSTICKHAERLNADLGPHPR